MTEIHMHQFLSLLKESHLVSADCTEKDFLDILYGVSDENLKILKWLISQFSDDYKHDIESTENGLATRLCALQFMKSSNVLPFIQGTCPREVQKEMYDNIFRALHFILLSKDHNHEFSKNTDHYQHKPLCRKLKRGKVFAKQFDLQKAKKNSDEAVKLDERLLTLSGKFQTPPAVEPEPKARQLCVTDVEVSSISSSLNRLLSRPVLMPSQRPVVNEPASAELGDCVEKLHCALLPMKQEPNGDEFVRSTEINTKKTLEDSKKIARDINELIKNCNISKINLKNNNC